MTRKQRREVEPEAFAEESLGAARAAHLEFHVEGVGELRAKSLREGLSRLADSSILERYV